MTVKEIFESMEYGEAPESAAEAFAWITDNGARFGHFIDGAFTEAGEGFLSRNPANGETLATLTQGSAADVDLAVQAARKAQPKWEKLGGHGRARVLYAIARLLQKHSRLLRCLRPSTTASRSARVATLISPSCSGLFTIMRAWRS